MISLTRSRAPSQLDAAKEEELTAEYITKGTTVWNKQYIREGLLALSNSKCAYCEANVSEESKYMEVEHFRCKKDFPNLVVRWVNLLPACKHCNGNKSDYNVDVEGMLADPFSVTPSDHFYFQNYRLRWRDEIGRRSIEALYLNDSMRLVTVRMKIGEAIAHALEIIREQLEDFIAVTFPLARRRNAVVRGVEKLLDEAQPPSQFSALAATVLVSDPNYQWIRENLIALGLWGELETKHEEAIGVALLP